jgi:hypothetical protein
MKPGREPSLVDDVAAERQPLLPPPIPADGRPDGNTAVQVENAVTTVARISTLPEFRARLGASALNFFLSGIAMAAVGVITSAHTNIPNPD